jgi:hypothetical protein
MGVSQDDLNLYCCLSPVEAKWVQFWAIRISFIWLYTIGFFASLISLFWVRRDALEPKVSLIMMSITIILVIIVIISLLKKSPANKVNNWWLFSWAFIPLLIIGFYALFYYTLLSLSTNIISVQSPGNIVWNITQYSLWVGITGIIFTAIVIFCRFRKKRFE